MEAVKVMEQLGLDIGDSRLGLLWPLGSFLGPSIKLNIPLSLQL